MARLLPTDGRGILVGLAGLAGAVGFASVAGEDTPPGPVGRNADILIEGIREIEGAHVVGTEKTGHFMVEFDLPDQDPHYPSAVAFDMDTGRIEEVTIRLGPLGDQSAVDDETLWDLEAEWTDVVLDVAPESIMKELDGRNIDLGDKWVAEEVRPHVRLYEKEGGYDIPVGDLVTFLKDLSQRFESKFGTLSDRMHDPEFSDNFHRPR